MSQLISQFCEPFWQITVCLVVQLCLGLCDPLDGSPPGSSCPWDFSDKNTRMGCHFPPPGDLPNQGIKPATPVSSALWVGSLPTEPSGKPKVLVAQLCPTLCNSMDFSPTRLLCPWNSPGKKTGVGCHSVLQGNLPNPGIKPGAPALQADSLPSESLGN